MTERKCSPIEQRFWKKVKKTPSCWYWIGAKMKKGHGQINLGRRGLGLILAHRLSYEIHFGDIPRGLCVCHSCDIASCVNPKHLFLGTIQDNNLDMFQKKRNAKGSKMGVAKLSEKSIICIRDRAAAGEKQKDLAYDFKIAESTVSQIINRKRWAHV